MIILSMPVEEPQDPKPLPYPGPIRPADKFPNKRVKRFATKVRSGCLICRTRRIKCDETQPECRRCIASNRQCTYTRPTAHHVRSLAPQLHLSSNGEVSLYSSYGDESSRQYLHVFQYMVIPWLKPYGRVNFLQSILIRDSWNFPALRHAITAVGCAAKAYFAGREREIVGDVAGHYSKAIQHMYQYRTDSNIILAACILLWLCDSIMGHVRSALVHFKGLMEIVGQRTVSGQLSEYERLLMHSLFHSDTGMDRQIDHMVFPDALETIRSRLSDLNFARRVIARPDVAEEASLGWAVFHNHLVSYETRSSSSQAYSSTYIAQTILKYNDLRHRRISDSSLNITKDDLIAMNCHHRLLSLGVDSQVKVLDGDRSARSSPVLLEGLHDVLGQLESISATSLSQSPERQDVIVSIVTIVPYMLRLTDDRHIRERSMAMLSNMRRVEGFWSSGVVLALLHHVPVQYNEEEQLHVLSGDRIQSGMDTMPD